MLLLVPLVALLTVGLAVVIFGASRLATRRAGRSHDGNLGAGGLLPGLVVGGILVAVVTVLVVGLGTDAGRNDRRRGHDPAGVGPGSARASARATSSGPREPTPREVETGTRELVVTAPTRDRFPTPTVVDRIDGRVVLRVRALGFEPSASGRVEQCVASRVGFERCGNRFPVQFGDGGTARFQYLVGDTYLDGDAPRCVTGGTRCVVRLTDGDSAAVVHIVFGARVSPSRVTITPRPISIASGATVDVSLSGFARRDGVRVTVCAAPATGGTRRCGAPGPVARVRVDETGAGTTRLVLRKEGVGSDRVACGREAPCGIVVTAGSGIAIVPPVEVTFASGPGASYDATRLGLGLALATILLVIAALVVRATDWRKPSEAETPVMDAAPLADV